MTKRCVTEKVKMYMYHLFLYMCRLCVLVVKQRHKKKKEKKKKTTIRPTYPNLFSMLRQSNNFLF